MKDSLNAELYNVNTPSGGNLLNVPRSNAVVFSVLQEMEEQGIDTNLKVNKPVKIDFKYPDFSEEYTIERVQ